MIVAIDGTAGSGKGTVSKLIAERLGFTYIDTGAMYRAVTLKMVRNNIGITELDKIKDMMETIKIELESTTNENGEYCQKVYLDGEDVSLEIRTPEITALTSPYSIEPTIRVKIVEMQREYGKFKDIVMEGRDITTVVFPNAELKIYLDASPEERANRRYKEYLEKGEEADLEQIKKDIEERDYRDMHRENSPLREAEDAIHMDSTGMEIDEEVAYIIEFCKHARGE
jgi:cytidylate kinase